MGRRLGVVAIRRGSTTISMVEVNVSAILSTHLVHTSLQQSLQEPRIIGSSTSRTPLSRRRTILLLLLLLRRLPILRLLLRRLAILLLLLGLSSIPRRSSPRRSIPTRLLLSRRWARGGRVSARGTTAWGGKRSTGLLTGRWAGRGTVLLLLLLGLTVSVCVVVEGVHGGCD